MGDPSSSKSSPSSLFGAAAIAVVALFLGPPVMSWWGDQYNSWQKRVDEEKNKKYWAAKAEPDLRRFATDAVKENGLAKQCFDAAISWQREYYPSDGHASHQLEDEAKNGWGWNTLQCHVTKDGKKNEAEVALLSSGGYFGLYIRKEFDIAKGGVTARWVLADQKTAPVSPEVIGDYNSLMTQAYERLKPEVR